MKSKADLLKDMVRAIVRTEDHELGCDECFEHIDRFVDMKLAGMDVAQMMPLVEAHLQRCPGCRAEYEALLEALQSLEE